jgi:large subunit ribosomal protein L10
MAGLTKNFARKKPASRKNDIVTEFENSLDQASVTVLVEYRGLSVAQLSKVRRELRKEDATLTVLKNTLAKRALVNKSIDEAFVSNFKGPIAVLFGKNDQVMPVKAFAKVMKEMKKEAVFQGGLLDGQVLNSADVDQLVSMPPLLELRAKLLGGIASPVTGLVAAISGPQRALVNVLDQYAKQKQS